nr:hypothetical protein [Heyndrickxia oleronia]
MTVVNIILCCSSGMSTSILSKRTKLAADKQSISLHIEAVDSTLVERKLEQAELILLGPHLKYKLEILRNLAPLSTRIEMIDKAIYQSFDGNQLLKFILSLDLKTKKEIEKSTKEESEEKGWTNQSPFKSYFTPEMLEALRWKR